MLKERRVAVSKMEENDALIAAPSAEQTGCEQAGEVKKLDVESDQRWQVKLTVTAALSELNGVQQRRGYVVMVDFKGACERSELRADGAAITLMLMCCP